MRMRNWEERDALEAMFLNLMEDTRPLALHMAKSKADTASEVVKAITDKHDTKLNALRDKLQQDPKYIAAQKNASMLRETYKALCDDHAKKCKRLKDRMVPKIILDKSIDVAKLVEEFKAEIRK